MREVLRGPRFTDLTGTTTINARGSPLLDDSPPTGRFGVVVVGAAFLLEMAENISDAVGGHTGKNRHRNLARHRIDDFGRTFESRLIENVDGAVWREMQDDRRRLLRRVIVQDFDNIGGVLIAETRGERRRIELNFGEVLCFAHGSPVPIRRQGDRGSR